MKTVISATVIVAALVPWQPLAAAATMVTTDLEGQPLTRAACDKAGLAWNDNRNVCNWEPRQEIASELITGSIASSQPLTRAACDKAGLAWNDNRNVCDSAESQSSPTSAIASKAQRATKQSARVNSHTKTKYTQTRKTQVTKTKYTQTRQTQVANSRPFPLFRLFRN
jgi:hypothetical protein